MKPGGMSLWIRSALATDSERCVKNHRFFRDRRSRFSENKERSSVFILIHTNRDFLLRMLSVAYSRPKYLVFPD
jgi:hypothetical protein